MPDTLAARKRAKMQNSFISNTAPTFRVRLAPSLRCWQCKRALQAPLPLGCTGIFPAHSMCSVPCAKRFVMDCPHVCMQEKHAALVAITESILDTGGDPACETMAISKGWFQSSDYGHAEFSPCWGCFQPVDSQGRPVVCVTQPDGGGRVGRFHSHGCLLRFLRDRMLEPSLRSRITFWSCKGQQRPVLGCDWRLHEEFGGPFPTLPELPLSVLGIEAGQGCWEAVVMQHADTMPMRYNITGVAEDGEEVRSWAKNSRPDLWKEGESVAKPQRRTHVQRILDSMPPDNPIALWHAAHKDHPKASQFVLFRDKDLPFKMNEAMSRKRQGAELDMEDDDVV